MREFDFTECNILIVGDIMLDQYVQGNVSRISPEAPVPVVRVSGISYSLGGAGNALNNIVHLKASGLIIGMTGNDHNGRILRDKLDEIGADYRLLECMGKTNTKIRVIGSKQQIVRIDIEDIREINKKDEDSVLNYSREFIRDVKLIVISDYGKGLCSYNVCQGIIGLAREYGIHVIIDPKGDNWDKYRNATIVTPNLNELALISGKEILNNDSRIIEECGLEIIRRYGISALIVTRSERGISIITGDSAEHIHAEAKDVYDVSGAGDTVVGTLAVSLAAGMSLRESVKLANKAAGIVVGKSGTAPVEIDELNVSLSGKTRLKIIAADSLEEILNSIRSRSQTIVFTNGCFDVLHKGHMACLSGAKEMGDVLIVGLNSDSSVMELKGPGRPVNNEKDRAEVLSSLEFVDYIVLFGERTPSELIRTVKPDILVKGGDYKIDEIAGREFAGEVRIIPYIDGYSSSKIINSL